MPLDSEDPAGKISKYTRQYASPYPGNMGRKKLLNKDQVLAAIQWWIAHHGGPPTVDELRKELGVGSGRTVLRYLAWLEEAGDIERWPGARGMRPLRASKGSLTTVPVPIAGEAPAGPFMVAEQNIEGWVRVPKELIRPSTSKFFFLRVRGDSMNRAKVKGERIESGDLALVESREVAANNEVVVGLVDGEATIKRLVKGPSTWFLRPESTNSKHHPIMVRDGFRVQGVVRKILKKGSDLLNLVEG